MSFKSPAATPEKLAYGVLCGALIWLLTNGVAQAHPLLDAALAHAHEAEFEAALRGFNQALATGKLNREELALLLSERVLVLQALHQEEQLALDLLALALIAPQHDFGRQAPPALRAAWDQTRFGRRALAVAPSCEVGPEHAQIRAQPSAATGHALATTLIYTRSDDAVWRSQRGEELSLPSAEGDALAYYVEVTGLGGVVLARAGSADAPLTCQKPAPASAPLASETEHKRRMWWWIGGGSAVAMAALAIALVSTRSPEAADETDVGAPVVRWP